MTAISNATNPAVSTIFDVNSGGVQNIGDKSGGASLSVLRFEKSMSNADTMQVQPANFRTLQAAPGSNALDGATQPNGLILAQATPGQQVDPLSSTAPSGDGAVPTSETDRTRALRGLDLSNDVAAVDTTQTGDTIIDGLSKLRGVFDAQEQAVLGVSGPATGGGSLTNSSALINLQLEVVKYSMLMDVTSKLAGKSTQTFDTLLKGQ